MAAVEEEGVPCEEQQEQQEQQEPPREQEQRGPSSPPAAAAPPEDTPPAARPGDTAERAAETKAPPVQHLAPVPVDAPLLQYKLRKFFVLRPGTLNQGITDVQALVDKEVDGGIHGIWLMTEVDHWNNEKERLVLVTDSSLLVFKYDFVLFNCEQFQRIPLNFVDRISHGAFRFPKGSLPRREGEGVRVYWDRLREPSFTSRWNPFTTDYPFVTFTHHPVSNVSESFAALCDIHTFREKLKDAAQKVHVLRPVPGKANGVLVLNQELPIETYVGLMSFLGNQNKLGYSMARGNLGF